MQFINTFAFKLQLCKKQTPLNFFSSKKPLELGTFIELIIFI